MNKWTPGPWSHRNGRIVQTDREELTIAKVAIAFDGDYSKANGCMLAAAPDLAEALERCVEAIREYGRNEGEPTPQDEELFDAERAARAALRKAKGGSMSAGDDAVLFASNQLALMQALRRVLDAYEYRDRDEARAAAEKLLREMDSADAVAAYIDRETA